MSCSYYVWISFLIDSYEPIFRRELISLGYDPQPAAQSSNSFINTRHCAGYLLHRQDNKSISEVDADIEHILNMHNMKCHCSLIANVVPNACILWRGSNIIFDNEQQQSSTITNNQQPSFPPINKPILKPSGNEELDNVVVQMHRIIDQNDKLIRDMKK